MTRNIFETKKLLQMETRTKDVPSLIEFVKELNEDSLEPLIKELKEEPSPFSVYYDRTKQDWKDWSIR
jgi:hypothetical protein